MKIINPDNTTEPFDRSKLRESMSRRGMSRVLANAISKRVKMKLRAASETEIPYSELSRFIGESVLEITGESTRPSAELGTGLRSNFTWSELLPVMKSTAVRPVPTVAMLTAPSGRYVSDHISASRHIAVALWSQMDSFGEMATGISEERRRFVKNAAFAAAVHFARAEAAVVDASFWQIGPRHGHDKRERAKDFVREKRGALKDAVKQLENGIADLRPLADVPLEAQESATEPKKTGSAAADAISQAEAILEGILRLIELLGGDTGEDDEEELSPLTEAVTALAEAIGGGARAAVIGAIGDVIEAVSDTASATPEDIDVSVDPQSGEVTIYFRIEFSCLFIFDFLMEDDFVWIEKNTKTGAFTFSSGESARRHHEQHLQQVESGE